jgi:YVTN family beta-propeller protein
MYVAGHNSNTVSIIYTRTNKLIDTITAFKDPTGVGYNSDTHNIYVGNQDSNYVSIISGSTNKVIGTVTVGRGPVSPVFDPDNGNVYVTNFGTNEDPNNTVSVIATTILTPKQAIQKLIHSIDNMHLSKGTTTSLEASLNAVIKQLDYNNIVTTCNSLNTFLRKVIADESNGQLTSKQAANLRQQALSIQHVLGCSIGPSNGQGGSGGNGGLGGEGGTGGSANGGTSGNARGGNAGTDGTGSSNVLPTLKRYLLFLT